MIAETNARLLLDSELDDRPPRNALEWEEWANAAAALAAPGAGIVLRIEPRVPSGRVARRVRPLGWAVYLLWEGLAAGSYVPQYNIHSIDARRLGTWRNLVRHSLRGYLWRFTRSEPLYLDGLDLAELATLLRLHLDGPGGGL